MSDSAAPPPCQTDIGPSVGDLTLLLRWSAASGTDDLKLYGGKMLLGEVFWVDHVRTRDRTWRAGGLGSFSHRSGHATRQEAQEALLAAVRALADG